MEELTQKYVLIFVQDNNHILMIEKQKPNWMKGKLNLLGGKIELNESSKNAAIRELKEESGLVPIDENCVEWMGDIIGDFGEVNCWKIQTTTNLLNPRKEEVEQVFWVDWDTLKDDIRLIPNLKIIIPLIVGGCKKWKINCDSFVDENYDFIISV